MLKQINKNPTNYIVIKFKAGFYIILSNNIKKLYIVFNIYVDNKIENLFFKFSINNIKL